MESASVPCEASAESLPMDTQPVDADGSPPPLHVVSWNVAGWLRTVSVMRQHNRSVGEWLARHRIDILALQEVKTTAAKLTAEPGAHDAGIEGYDTFWSCCTAEKSIGFNGVATFARKGLTVSANAQLFGDPELDQEGRCIVTDHGAFVLINVYVPNSGRSSRLPFAVKFLHQLRAKMLELRAQGRAVMLVGDLNLKARPVDVCEEWRSVYVSQIVEQSLPLKVDAATHAVLQRHWPMVRRQLLEATVRAKTVNTSRGKQEKFKLVAVNAAGDAVELGTPCESAESAKAEYCLEPRKSVCADTGETVLLSPGDELSLGQLVECMQKIANVVLNAEQQAQLLQAMDSAPILSPTRRWFHQLLADGFVDTFAVTHPRAAGRFTCWDQASSPKKK